MGRCTLVPWDNSVTWPDPRTSRRITERRQRISSRPGLAWNTPHTCFAWCTPSASAFRRYREGLNQTKGIMRTHSVAKTPTDVDEIHRRLGSRPTGKTPARNYTFTCTRHTRPTGTRPQPGIPSTLPIHRPCDTGTRIVHGGATRDEEWIMVRGSVSVLSLATEYLTSASYTWKSRAEVTAQKPFRGRTTHTERHP